MLASIWLTISLAFDWKRCLLRNTRKLAKEKQAKVTTRAVTAAIATMAWVAFSNFASGAGFGGDSVWESAFGASNVGGLGNGWVVESLGGGLFISVRGLAGGGGSVRNPGGARLKGSCAACAPGMPACTMFSGTYLRAL